MTSYMRAILIYGLTLPGLVILLIFAGAGFGLNKVGAAKKRIQVLAEEVRKTTAEVATVDAKLEGRVERMAAWDKCIQGEVIQQITRVLQEVMEPYSEEELKQTQLGRPANRSTLAGGTENHYVRFEIAFEGGYGPMQQVLAALEARMPHMVLEDFSVEPGRNKKALTFKVTYTCWCAAPKSPVS